MSDTLAAKSLPVRLDLEYHDIRGERPCSAQHLAGTSSRQAIVFSVTSHDDLGPVTGDTNIPSLEVGAEGRQIAATLSSAVSCCQYPGTIPLGGVGGGRREKLEVCEDGVEPQPCYSVHRLRQPTTPRLVSLCALSSRKGAEVFKIVMVT